MCQTSKSQRLKKWTKVLKIVHCLDIAVILLIATFGMFLKYLIAMNSHVHKWDVLYRQVSNIRGTLVGN